MSIPRWHSGRRFRICAAVAWTAAAVVFAWGSIVHVEAAEAREALRSVAEDGAGAGAPGLRSSERLDRLRGGVERARSAVGDVGRYTVPVRATAGAWGWVPSWGGDISQLEQLLEYAESLLDGIDGLLRPADAVVDGEGGEATVDRLRALAEGLEGERAALEAGAASLADAGRLHSRIDESALSSSVQDMLRSAEALRRDALLAAEVAALAPPLLEAAATVVSLGQRGPWSASSARFIDLADLGSALASLERRWPDIVSAGERLGPMMGLDASEVRRSAAHGLRALQALRALAAAAEDAQSVLAAGLPATAETSEGLGDSLSAVRVQAAAAQEALLATRELLPGPLGLIAGGVRTVETFAAFLWRFLGYERPSIHLFLGQDDEELRPSGGFMAVVWELRFDRGRLQWQRFVDSYRVDRLIPLDQWLAAPASFELGLGAEIMPFRDQNWWADFPRSAQTIRATYELSARVRVDSVIAFNQAAVERLLELTGPLRLRAPSGAGEEVDAAMVRGFLREGRPPPGYASAWDENRYASYLVGRAIIDFFTGGRGVQTQSLVAALLGLLESGDLLVSADDPEFEAAFNALGWDGSLPELRDDGFYWVESNAYAPKISHLLRRSFVHRVRVGPDGSATGQVVVRYENPASSSSLRCLQPSLPPQAPCYWLLFRLYLPAGAEVLEVPALPLLEGAVAAWVAPAGVDTVAVARGADGEPAEAVEVSGLATVPAGGASEWTFRYRLPGAALPDGEGGWHYAWQAARQPGMRGATFRVEVRLPDGACAVGAGTRSGAPSFDLPDERWMSVAVDYAPAGPACAE